MTSLKLEVGLALGLDRGGSCTGLAFRIAADERERLETARLAAEAAEKESEEPVHSDKR